jgi:hypothetical protein
MSESEDTFWYAYKHVTEDGREQFVKVLFDGFGYTTENVPEGITDHVLEFTRKTCPEWFKDE